MHPKYLTAIKAMNGGNVETFNSAASLFGQYRRMDTILSDLLYFSTLHLAGMSSMKHIGSVSRGVWVVCVPCTLLIPSTLAYNRGVRPLSSMNINLVLP